MVENIINVVMRVFFFFPGEKNFNFGNKFTIFHVGSQMALETFELRALIRNHYKYFPLNSGDLMY